MANANFFRSLPGDQLAPMENSLRKVLTKAIQSMGGKPFPLIEWIDRRIGGEIETVAGPGGAEVRLRGQGDRGGPPRGAMATGGPEAFFATLPDGAFDPPEEALREAVFEFLATWSSTSLASLQQMQQYPEVQRRSKAFLPKHIKLKDWIEHRIGAEIEFRPNPSGGPDVVHLTELARGSVMAKFQQISSRPMGAPPRGGPHPPMPPDSGDKDQFFATLPAGELLPVEHALRDALLAWLDRVTRERRGAPAHLSDSGNDEDVKAARTQLLPPKVKISEWIEHRIGGEVELRYAGSGQHQVFLRGQAPPAARGRPPKARDGGAGKGGGGEKPANKKDEDMEQFFSSLPGDDFSDEEENLRMALLEFIDRWTGEEPPNISDLVFEEDLQAAKKALLPKGCRVGLKDWIDRRIGGEIETRAAPGGGGTGVGTWIFGLRGTLGAKKRRTE